MRACPGTCKQVVNLNITHNIFSFYSRGSIFIVTRLLINLVYSGEITKSDGLYSRISTGNKRLINSHRLGGVLCVDLRALAMTCTLAHTHTDVCALTHVCVYTVWLCWEEKMSLLWRRNFRRWVLAHKAGMLTMCNISKRQKKKYIKINIENIKDLTQISVDFLLLPWSAWVNLLLF